MEIFGLVLSMVALAGAIFVYYKAGGVADFKEKIHNIASSEELKKSVESLKGAVETLREKTGEGMAKLKALSNSETTGEKNTLESKLSKGSEELKKRMRTGGKSLQNALRNSLAWTQKQTKSLAELKSGDSKQSVEAEPGSNPQVGEEIIARGEGDIERRKHKRVPVDFTVTYRVWGTTVTGRALNACNEGMMVESSLDFAVARQILDVLGKNGNNRLQVEFTYKKAYRTEAEIRHFRLAPNGPANYRSEVGFFIPRIR
jgi:hypothetical protein